MNELFGGNLLLHSGSAEKIWDSVAELPVIDYHCHLDQNMIRSDARFSDIGELWLAGDHYKWRAMRLCGVEEKYITGDASWEEKFAAYARILPLLAGNPLYDWTHLELRRIYGIDEPLNAGSAARIYRQANEKPVTVRGLLKQFRVQFVATTDDPADDLAAHGKYGGTLVSPTFRPDKLYDPDDGYLEKLGAAAGVRIGSLDDLLEALTRRLDYFVSKGCRISDHGFAKFPERYADHAEAKELFMARGTLTPAQKDAFFGFLLVWLAREYGKRGLLMQMHFSVMRNCNARMFAQCGADAGFDLPAAEQSAEGLVRFLGQLSDEERPETVLYTLNDANLPALAAATGAFRKVRMGAAWWFNDTVQGIRKNLRTVMEYSVLGTNLGMLTDSRSFSSYVRFEFFRRILADELGTLVQEGRCDLATAQAVARRVCYENAKEALRL